MKTREILSSLCTKYKQLSESRQIYDCNCYIVCSESEQWIQRCTLCSDCSHTFVSFHTVFLLLKEWGQHLPCFCSFYSHKQPYIFYHFLVFALVIIIIFNFFFPFQFRWDFSSTSPLFLFFYSHRQPYIFYHFLVFALVIIIIFNFFFPFQFRWDFSAHHKQMLNKIYIIFPEVCAFGTLIHFDPMPPPINDPLPREFGLLT